MLVTPAAGQPSRRSQAWLTYNVRQNMSASHSPRWRSVLHVWWPLAWRAVLFYYALLLTITLVQACLDTGFQIAGRVSPISVHYSPYALHLLQIGSLILAVRSVLQKKFPAFSIVLTPKDEKPNQPPEPTATAVTPAAEQPARQP